MREREGGKVKVKEEREGRNGVNERMLLTE